MSDHDERDEDDIFAELEAEIENDDSIVREHGAELLRRRMEEIREVNKGGHGQYTEIINEKEVIRTSASEARCVIHFYHTDFKRCETMDKHLAKLAVKYPSTRFIRVFVENIPWLVEKLTVKVLPCVICFISGVTKDKLVGFEELGDGKDVFQTSDLERRLMISGVLLQRDIGSSMSAYKMSATTTSARNIRQDDGDEIFDL